MAIIIENGRKSRRIIKLSTADIISIVSEYQRLTYSKRNYSDVTDILNDKVIFIPEG